MTVTLMMLPGDPSNMPAWKAVRSITGTEVKVVHCPESMEDHFPMPFIRTEDNVCHFGTEGIDWFAERARQQRNNAAQARVDANLRKVFG